MGRRQHSLTEPRRVHHQELDQDRTMDIGDFHRLQSRRSILKRSAGGTGMIALWHLLALDGKAAEPVPEVNPLQPKPPHFPARAKNVIFVFMAGGPSHLDLFDP